MIYKAFTLIELLVVVAIIGILAAVGVPIFQGFMEDSKSTIAKENNAVMCDTIRYSQFRCNIDASPQSLSGTPYELKCGGQIQDQIRRYVEHSKALFSNPYKPTEKGCRYGALRPIKKIGITTDVSIGTCMIGWIEPPQTKSGRQIQCDTKIEEGATDVTKPVVIVDSVNWWRKGW